MNIGRLFLSLLLIFFSLQLIFGEAGIIAFVQQKEFTNHFYENVNELIVLNQYLTKQVDLIKNNRSHLLMNSHRVGLLAEGEYLIKVDNSLFQNSVVYSPGSIVLEKQNFSFNNLFLFIFSVFLLLAIVSVKILNQFLNKIKTSKIGKDWVGEDSLEEFDESGNSGFSEISSEASLGNKKDNLSAFSTSKSRYHAIKSNNVNILDEEDILYSNKEKFQESTTFQKIYYEHEDNITKSESESRYREHL